MTPLISNINPLKMKMNMKKIISWGMMLAAAFTLTNCAKEIDAPVQEPESVGYPFEIVASTVDTKTVNDGMSTNWKAEDQINLFHAVGETTGYVNNNAFTVSDLAEGRFTGNLASELDPQEEYDWFAFYPYSSFIKTPANTSAGYMTVGSSASGVQVQKGNGSMSHIAGENYPLVGRAIAVPANSTPKMVMSHVSSLIAVNVKNALEEPLIVESVSFNAPVEIVGTYYINFAGDITPESFTGSGDQYVSKAATLKVEGGTAIATDQSAVFYLAVKPFVAKANDKLVVTVNGYAKELTMTKDLTFSAGKIKTLNFAYDKVKEAGVATATISFASDAQRTSFSGDAQVWENDGITFTNTKASSTSAVVNNVAPVRLYKNSAIKIEAPGLITKIEFNSATGDYFANLKNLLPNASVSGQIVTEVYDGSSTSVSYSLTTGQVRLNSITVTYSSAGENPDQPENPEPEVVTLSSIKVSDDAKTKYTVGEEFVEPTVVATYSDNTTKEVDAEFSGYNMLVAGTQTVTVSYTDGEHTATTSYSINVSASVVLVEDGTYVIAVKEEGVYYAASSDANSSRRAYVEMNGYSSGDYVSNDSKIVWTIANSGVGITVCAGDKYWSAVKNGISLGDTATIISVASSETEGAYLLSADCGSDGIRYLAKNGTYGFGFYDQSNKDDIYLIPATFVELPNLDAPTVTAVLNADETGIDVSWTAVENATSYVISGVGDDVTTNETSYSFADLNPGTYNITVKAMADGYKSATSDAQILVVPVPESGDSGDEGEPQVVFSETFTGTNGTMGWTGSVANGNSIKYDNAGWSVTNAYGASNAIKLGSSSKKGSATTPALAITGNATLKFKAGAWSGDQTTLVLKMTGGTLGQASVTMKSGDWTEYEVSITGATSGATITFEGKQASKARFFLDDVQIIQ